MKVQFVSAYRRSGVSKTSQRPYDFAQIEYAAPIREIDTPNFQQKGTGFEVKSLPLANHVISEFNGLSLGDDIELKIVPNPEDPTRNICIGLA